MLVSDRFYNRIPRIWLFMGTLFLFLGLATGPDFHYFYAYLSLGTICMARAFLIYQYRRKISRRNRITVLTKTQKIERDTQQS
jgi:hypothetical protein